MGRPERVTMHRRDLLLALSEELNDLSASTMSIQTTLGRILDDAAASGEREIWQIQQIDRLQQTIDDIAAILRQAAGDDGLHLDLDRLMAVARLGSVRDRLCGADSATSRAETGRVAFF